MALSTLSSFFGNGINYNHHDRESKGSGTGLIPITIPSIKNSGVGNGNGNPTGCFFNSFVNGLTLQDAFVSFDEVDEPSLKSFLREVGQRILYLRDLSLEKTQAKDIAAGKALSYYEKLAKKTKEKKGPRGLDGRDGIVSSDVRRTNLNACLRCSSQQTVKDCLKAIIAWKMESIFGLYLDYQMEQTDVLSKQLHMAMDRGIERNSLSMIDMSDVAQESKKKVVPSMPVPNVPAPAFRALRVDVEDVAKAHPVTGSGKRTRVVVDSSDEPLVVNEMDEIKVEVELPNPETEKLPDSLIETAKELGIELFSGTDGPNGNRCRCATKSTGAQCKLKAVNNQICNIHHKMLFGSKSESKFESKVAKSPVAPKAKVSQVPSETKVPVAPKIAPVIAVPSSPISSEVEWKAQAKGMELVSVSSAGENCRCCTKAGAQCKLKAKTDGVCGLHLKIINSP